MIDFFVDRIRNAPLFQERAQMSPVMRIYARSQNKGKNNPYLTSLRPDITLFSVQTKTMNPIYPKILGVLENKN